MGEKQQLPGVFMSKNAAKGERNWPHSFKYMLIILNVVYFILGLSLLGVCIWMTVDRTYLMYVTGNALYATGVYIGLASAILMLIISGVGLFGALLEHRIMLWVYFIVVIVLFFTLLIGGILAAIFNRQIGKSMQDAMANSLLTNYGVNFNSYWNELVTRGWDMTQEKLGCCGVNSTNGWVIYRDSNWFKQYGANFEETGIRTGSEMDKPYVPMSCCVRDRWWRVLDADTCQRWELGPPKQPDSGSAYNRALSYQGCYDAMQQFCRDNVAIITTIMVFLGVTMIAGAVLSFLLIKSLF